MDVSHTFKFHFMKLEFTFSFHDNYKEQDYIDILKHSSFDYKTDQEIKEFIEHNLKSLDNIYIEKGEKND